MLIRQFSRRELCERAFTCVGTGRTRRDRKEIAIEGAHTQCGRKITKIRIRMKYRARVVCGGKVLVYS